MTIVTTIIVAVLAAAAAYLVATLVAGRRRQQLTNQVASLETQLKLADEQMARAQAEWDSRSAAAQAAAEATQRSAIEAKDSYYTKLLQEQERRHRESVDALQKRFDDTMDNVAKRMQIATDDMLKKRQEEFSTSSNLNLAGIVNPLKETIKKMEEAMSNNTTAQTKMSAEIRTNMDQMIQQSIAAQKSADELTRAFKHETKTQGNWGEVVLSELLQSQGLQEGVHYSVQETMRDADGKVLYSADGSRMIPDVTLHLDHDRDIIIDSKVSMTKFIEYTNADDELTRNAAMAAHIASLEKHVKELAGKDYSSHQTKSHIDFVIMFVPHSPALWEATKRKPSLWRDAMQQKVFIADEQTLYAALKIIQLTWTQIDQEKNHERLYKLAQEMIKRTGMFLEEYDRIGDSLENARKAFAAGRIKLQPGGMSISTTANNILDLGGFTNKRPARNKHGVENIIPESYLTPESAEQLMEGTENDEQD